MAKEFDDMQTEWIMREICCGLEHGVDIAVYADPKRFDAGQMYEIRRGLEHEVDVSAYADPKFDCEQME